MILNKYFRFLKFPLEAIFWASGLIFLAIFDATTHSHFTLCPLALSGIEWCPGCGLGRSISLIFRGEFAQAYTMHPMGIVAVIILISRIIDLTKTYTINYGQSH